MIPLLIILGLLAVLVIWVIGLYNGLVRLRNAVRSSWSDIDVQLKRRFDLIPNLVETVKGYASHEKGVFEKVTEARSRAMQVVTPGEKAQAENMLSGTLKSLFAVAEAYPELKANTNFLDLQKQLQLLEQDIEAARRYYNAVVRDFNTAVETFPAVIIAGSLGFRAAEFFELDSPEERRPGKVDFSN